jgi:hypothetical protein
MNLPAFVSNGADDDISGCFFGAEKGNAWVKKMLSYYDDHPFIKDNGELDSRVNSNIYGELTKEMYPELRLDDSEQHYEYVSIFPNDYFMGNDFFKGKYRTKRTIVFHHNLVSWLPNLDLFQKAHIKLMKIYRKIVGRKCYEKHLFIRRIYTFIESLVSLHKYYSGFLYIPTWVKKKIGLRLKT